MDAKAILRWLKEEAKIVRMHEVTDIVLGKLVEKFDYLAAVFYDLDDDPVLQNLQKIAADSQKNGVAMVKVNDDEEARLMHSYGKNFKSQPIINSKDLFQVTWTGRAPTTGAVPQQDPDADEGDGHPAARRDPRLDRQEAVGQQHHGSHR